MKVAIYRMLLRRSTIPRRRLDGMWRTGSEGQISYLKHHYEWDRTRMDGIDSARIWCGQGSWPTTWSRSVGSYMPTSYANQQRAA
jgi:IS5 family transposase